ncbi:MAG TPA: (2Fe-2S)-binding protein [Conexivisphaerales archaeon]|nr:(2Fe-2S)-binding protein [Conexivisphaerales archaeon]
MTSETEQKKGATRRQFLIGAGAGAVVGAVIVAGVEEGIRIPGLPGGTSTVTNTTTIPGGTTTVTVTGAAAQQPVTSKTVTITVNGTPQTVAVDANDMLIDVLRDELKLFGTKEGCYLGECGACTVIMDGTAVNSCQILAIEADGHQVTTIEGIGTPDKLHPLQAAFIKYEGGQCGFCTPGQIMSAKALLDANPHPTMDDIRNALVGNLCICGNYRKIAMAVASVGGS